MSQELAAGTWRCVGMGDVGGEAIWRKEKRMRAHRYEFLEVREMIWSPPLRRSPA